MQNDPEAVEMADPDAHGAGVLIPGVDPAIAELALLTINNNPTKKLSEIAVAMAQTAPAPEIAVQMIDAMMEMTLCKAVGDLRWLEVDGSMLLTGLRRIPGRNAVAFGGAEWPQAALAMSQVAAVSIATKEGRRKLYVAGNPLDGVVVGHQEATVLGLAMIEELGGTIFDDRRGKKSLKEAESGLSKLARMRAKAIAAAEDLKKAMATVDKQYAVVPMIEFFAGQLQVGDLVIPAENSMLTGQNEPPVYKVTAPCGGEWVILAATEPGVDQQVEGGDWMLLNGSGIGEAGTIVGTSLGAALCGHPKTESDPEGEGAGGGDDGAVSPDGN